LISAITRPSPKGITAQPIMASVKVMIGARMKTTLLAPVGKMVSFIKSFTASAIGCKRPMGPTTIGPWRSCMAPITLRSA